MDFHHLPPADLPGAPQLNTGAVGSPVNASRRPSRDAAHHSGSGWLARPSPWGTFTSYSLPASWRTPRWATSRLSRCKKDRKTFVRRPDEYSARPPAHPAAVAYL